MASMATDYATSLTSERDYDSIAYPSYRDDSMELNLLSKASSQTHRYRPPLDASRTLSKRSHFWVYRQLAAFYFSALLFMGIHLGFYLSLNNVPVAATKITEPMQSAFGNILAIFVEISLLSGISVAYDQVLWRLFRRKTLKALVIDKLATLVTSPWNLFRKEIIITAPLEWSLGLCCFLVAIAAVFPPGALTVKFEPYILPVERRIPSLNISDWGNGTMEEFADRALFLMDALFQQTKIRPDLNLIANGVLSAGRPLHPACYYTPSCQYIVGVSGPAFNCSESSEAPESFDKCDFLYQATDHAVEDRDGIFGQNPVVNNSFTLSWRDQTPSREQWKSNDCEKPKNMKCTTEFGIWMFNISRTANGTSLFNSSFVRDDGLRWTNDLPVIKNFHNYFWVDHETLGLPTDVNGLTKQFTRTQAFAIRDAVVQALVGNVTLDYDEVVFENTSSSAVPYPETQGTLVVGSEFVSTFGSQTPVFDNISPARLEKYLQDVMISAVEKLSTEFETTIVFEGAEVFMFSAPEQFYGPYAACLLATLFIYIVGIWNIRLNGVSAGNSFLQWVTTTRVSERLDLMAKQCSPGGHENFSDNLASAELRFGIKRGNEEMEAGNNMGVAGFGFIDEVDPYHDV